MLNLMTDILQQRTEAKYAVKTPSDMDLIQIHPDGNFISEF